MASGKKSRREPIGRAEILLEVLGYINQDDYELSEEYMIFGGTLEDLLDAAENPGQEQHGENVERARQISEAIKLSVGDIQAHWARNRAMRRLSLNRQTGKPRIRGLDRLERLNAKGISDALRDTVEGPLPSETPSQALDRELDEYDAYFAKEILARLPRIVNRVSALSDLDIQGIPNERVRKYFEEAHRCYLYGFPVACAVLCRAIVESAINEILSLYATRGENPVPMEGKSGRSPELIESIGLAQQSGVLNEKGVVCAHDVRKFGNAAIHPGSDPRRFEQLAQRERIDEILANTREVLRELYGQVETR